MAALEDQYREIIREEMEKRVRANPSYSLRRFAQFLNLEPAHLSRVLSGVKNISPTTARFVAEKIFEDKTRGDYFVSLVEYSVARKSEHKRLALSQIKKTSSCMPAPSISLDTLNFMSDWYHMALLEICQIPSADMKPAVLAKQLELSVAEVKAALARLDRLGLIKKTSKKYTVINSKMFTPTNVPSAAIRSVHRQMMDRAKQALEKQPVEKRHYNAKTIAIHEDHIGPLKNLIDKFNQDVSQLVENSRKRPNRVYQLNVQMFDLLSGK